jgi:hypothetical protein
MKVGQRRPGNGVHDKVKTAEMLDRLTDKLFKGTVLRDIALHNGNAQRLGHWQCVAKRLFIQALGDKLCTLAMELLEYRCGDAFVVGQTHDKTAFALQGRG